MVGNDIVDLQYAKVESNWKRSRFLEKIFTEKERKYVLEAENPEYVVWLLWSMKESVYKIVVRQEERRFFAPKMFVCDDVRPRRHKYTKGLPIFLWDFASLWQRRYEVAPNYTVCDSTELFLEGKVSYQNKTFYTQTRLTQHYIHTISHYLASRCSPHHGTSYLHHNTFYLPQTNPTSQSQYTRAQFLYFYAQKRNLPSEKLSIQKDSLGIPYIYFQNQPQPAVVSLSHHGNYGGFAIHLHHD